MNVNVEAPAANLIEEYLLLRDGLKKFEEKTENIIHERFSKRMTEIEDTLMAKLEAEGSQNIKTSLGTAMKVTQTSVTIQDGALFRDHVITGRHWDLLDWRANKTSVKKLVVDKHDPVPPGLNFSQRYVVNVRKAS